ncbi:LysR family hca operon transcriptional activator [Acinetobacter calcoaceticus]|uniref:LysR family hca operon transcriptional activator n=1 Tax=Acinetobacter calcoaceticus TaxID=471 RepID=A0A4R1Y0Z4_ACICA|nr:LysR family hca operon transcriptional activator [Acinetobacter calcoaceticus]
MLALRHLRYFLSISEEKSFVSAAKKLNTVQSSLSQQMKDLEDYIGVELFERGGRVFKLTKAGEVFLEEAKKTLVEAEKTRNFAKKLNSKYATVKIGVLNGVEVKIPSIILDSIKDHEAQVKVELISDTGPALITQLEKGEIDFSFTRNNIQNVEMSSVECLEEDLLLVLPKNHPLNKYSYIPLKELNGVDFILPAVTHAPELRALILGIMQKNNIELNVVMEAENAFVTMSYVNMGMGVSILPDFIHGIATTNTVIKKFTNINPRIKLYLNYKNTKNSASLDALIENFKRMKTK